MDYSAQSLSQFATNSYNKHSEVIQLWTRGYSQRSLAHLVKLSLEDFKRLLAVRTAQSAVASFPEQTTSLQDQT